MKGKIIEVYSQPQPRQIAFFDSTAKYRLYGGQKGGGKSRAMRSEVFRLANSNKVRGLVLRRTTDEIQENMLIPMMSEIPTVLYDRKEKRGIMKFKKTGSTVKFGYCRNLKDVLQYQGVEFDFICIEELTHRTEEEFRILMSSLRSAKKYVNTSFLGSTNPGGKGHGRVKRLWINREFNENEDPNEYEFISASIYDNQYLLSNNPEYLKSLLALPEKQRRAYLEGDWDVFEGQYFTEFRRNIHVIETPYIPTEGIVRRIIALDYGFTNPSALYRMTQDTQGEVVCYRELYVTGKTYKQLHTLACEMTTAQEKIDFVVADPAVVNKKSETGGMTFKQTWTSFKVISANNSREDGRSLMRDYIHETAEGGGLSLKLTSNCKQAIRTIPELIHDNIRVEDLDTSGEDHAADAIRYGLLAFGRKSNTTKKVSSANQSLSMSSINEKITEISKRREGRKSNSLTKTF